MGVGNDRFRRTERRLTYILHTSELHLWCAFTSESMQKYMEAEWLNS